MRNMTMTELLVVAIESYIEAPTESQRLSIKKSGNDYL
jgi:hypothetical protein